MPNCRAAPPTQKPLALYSGIVTVGPDGSAEISFDIPEFAGTARVMAVAWSSTKVGRATTDVTVRDPVVLTATLPRFLLNGDHGTMSMDLDNVEGAAGDYTITVKATGPVKMTGNPATTVKLAAKQRTSLALALDAGGAGTANLDVDIAGPNGLTLARHYALDVKPATQVLARRSIRTLAKDESLTLTSDMFSDLVSGTGSVSLSASLSTALDAATILKALDRYPHGCSEQITSRAMPLLYVNDLAAGAHLAMDTAVDQRIKDAIERLLARQGSNGSFGLWSAGGDDAWLDAYVTDFLTRAREKGFCGAGHAVQERARPHQEFGGQRQRAGKGRRPRSRLRPLRARPQWRCADRRSALSRRHQAEQPRHPDCEIATGGGAGAGRRQGPRRAGLCGSARRAGAKAGDRVRPGRLRLGAARCGGAGVAGRRRQRAAGDADRRVQRVEAARGLTPYTSTQENAWMVLAARALAKETLTLDIDGQPVKTAVYRSYKAEAMAGKPVKITNTGDAPVQVVVSSRWSRCRRSAACCSRFRSRTTPTAFPRVALAVIGAAVWAVFGLLDRVLRSRC